MTDNKKKINSNSVVSNLTDHAVYTSVEQEEGPGPCKCNIIIILSCRRVYCVLLRVARGSSGRTNLRPVF